jgi:hypothetical protein
MRTTTPPTILALPRPEAAKSLGMSVSHFQRYVQPYIQCVPSGTKRLFLVSELQRWFDEHACEGGRVPERTGYHQE